MKLTALFPALLLICTALAGAGCSESPSTIAGNTPGTGDGAPHERALKAAHALGLDNFPAQVTDSALGWRISLAGDQYADAGVTVTLTAELEDSDGLLSRIYWSQTSGPGAAILTPEGVTTQVVLPEVSRLQQLSFQFSAMDVLGNLRALTTQVTVLPVLRPLSISATAGEESTQILNFTLRLDAPLVEPLDVSYATADGSAVAGEDYTATSGTLRLDAGQSEHVIAVPLLADDLREGNEQFLLYLEYSLDGQAYKSRAVGQIIDGQSGPILLTWPAVSENPADIGQTDLEGTRGVVRFQLQWPEEADAELGLSLGTPCDDDTLDDWVTLCGAIETQSGAHSVEFAFPQVAPHGEYKAEVIHLGGAATTYVLYIFFGDQSRKVTGSISPHNTYGLPPVVFTGVEAEPEEPANPGEPSEPALVTVQYAATAGGHIEGPAQQQLSPGGDAATVTAVANPGHRFIGWSDGETSAARTDTDLRADLSVTAQFSENILWNAAAHQGGISIEAFTDSALVSWPMAAGITYALYVSADSAMEPDNYSAYGAEFYPEVTSPMVIENLTEGEPVYLALAENGVVRQWSSFRPNSISPNHTVNATAVLDDGTQIVAGNFLYLGMPQRGAAYMAKSGQSRGHTMVSPEIIGETSTLEADGYGGWYIGGRFSSVNGEPRANLAHVDALGRLSDWAPQVGGGSISDLTLVDGVLYAAGSFSAIDGETRNQVAAFDTAGELLPWQTPYGFGAIGQLVEHDGVLYASGNFDIYGDDPRNNLAAFDLQLNLLPWNPQLNLQSRNPNADPGVNAMVIHEGAIYIAGDFNEVKGEPRDHLAALDVAGNLLPWNPGINGTPSCMAIDGNRVYLGGSFSSVAGQERNHLAAIDTDGSLLPWNPGANTSVNALVIDQGVIYIGGRFEQIGDHTRHYAAAVDIQGNVLPWHPSFDEFVNELAVDQDVIFAAGFFSQTNSEKRHRIAALAADGQLLPWHPVVNNYISNLATDGETLYVYGQFEEINGVARANLAAFSGAGELLPWAPRTDGFILQMTVWEDNIYLGGTFSNVNYGNRANLAAIGPDGLLLPWAPNPDGIISGMAWDDGTLFIGGGFSQVAGEARGPLAAFDAAGQLLPWNPPTDLQTPVVAASQGRVYAAGLFDAAENDVDEKLVAFSGLAHTPLWQTQTELHLTGIASGGAIRDLAVGEDTVYIVGEFEKVAGELREHVAAFDTQGQLLSWNPGFSHAVEDIEFLDEKIYFSGYFSRAAGQRRSNWAKFDKQGHLLSNGFLVRDN